MPSPSEIELSFYEKFFFARDLEPYAVQERAIEWIVRGESVLVTVPTGTGKTLMAKAGIWKALETGQTAIYTTPLRALTEEKYRELCEDFGDERVGFATGDYKVNPDAPVQVVVAEILWNRIYGDRVKAPADIVIMDEGHYFNEPERGHVWEQSIIGLDPRTQLVILSATVGEPEQFCNWVYSCRRVEMQLVQSTERRVPLHHVFRESYLIEIARELHANGEWPAIVFVFGREACFEKARLIKSCTRFTTDEERERIARECDHALLERGLAKELRPLLLHGIGVHHAGILPRYKQLVERLTLERLLRFVVSTETISAGINLPAKRVVFPELRKFIQGKGRLLLPSEYHQMAGRAGRPQFDTEGVAITLAPEEVVQEIRKESKDAARAGSSPDPVMVSKIRKTAYARARSAAAKDQDVTWDEDAHARIVAGKPAALSSRTKVTAEQILAIGLPDLAVETIGETPPPEPADLPASFHLDVRTVIAHLLLPERERLASYKRLGQVTDNLRAMGVVDEHGALIAGALIRQLRGIDGLFVHYVVMHTDLDYTLARALVEFLVDHEVIHRILSRKNDQEKRAWMKNRLHERRRDEPQVSWEDVEAEYEQKFPRELTPVEKLHAEFVAALPHPELHGGKTAKAIWAAMEDAQLQFMDFAEREDLAHEEGNLFSYLSRVMKCAKMLREATALDEFATLERGVRAVLSVIDPRVLEEA